MNVSNTQPDRASPPAIMPLEIGTQGEARVQTELPAADRFWNELCRAPAQAVRWDWFILLRVAQCANHDYPRIGHSIQLRDDPVRLGQPPFFNPPATTVARMTMRGPSELGARSAEPPSGAGTTSQVAWIYSYHFGLFGPFGPLPLHLTDYAYHQAFEKDPAFAAFCDILHHRFLCFFFRAWADGRKELDFDRRACQTPGGVTTDNDDFAERWNLYLGSLIGLGLSDFLHRDRLPAEAKLFYAGRLLQPTRNAEGLEALLGDYFQVPASVIPFVRRVVPLPTDVRWQLGVAGGFGYLDISAIVGEAVENYQTGFRVRLGPLQYAQFEQFLPDSDAFGQINDWIRLYVGKESDPGSTPGLEAAWDLQLVLNAADVPEMRLGEISRLGWTTWLLDHPGADYDADDLVLQPDLSQCAS